MGGTWEVGPGDTIFLKKGACFLRQRGADDICLFMFFIPDDFVRAAVRESHRTCRRCRPPPITRDMLIHVNDDAGVKAFLQAMAVFFSTPARHRSCC